MSGSLHNRLYDHNRPMTRRITRTGRDNALPARRQHDWQRRHAYGPLQPMNPRRSIWARIFRKD